MVDAKTPSKTPTKTISKTPETKDFSSQQMAAAQPTQLENQQSQPQAVKNVPTGVKIISVLDWIGAIIAILVGLLFAIVGGLAMGGGSSDGGLAALSGVISALGVLVIGIGVLVIGIFMIFVAKGLWQGKGWTRIAQIIISSLAIISGIVTWIQDSGVSIINLVYNIVVAGYLLFSPSVKEAFS
jgi:hypothetical protein